MKNTAFLIAIVCSLLTACRGPKSGDSDVTVPPGYYRVVGEVKKPGLIPCVGPEKTLVRLIAEAGGLTEFAYTKKILVVHSGVTNTFNYKQIRNASVEDPLVPSGSLIRIKRIAPF
jgi:protein involved in polysaccharide export with SLBB domain